MRQDLNSVTGSLTVCWLRANVVRERVDVVVVYKVLYCLKHTDGNTAVYLITQICGRVHKII